MPSTRLATFARRAALVGLGPYLMEAYCASGTAVFLGARPCFGVRAACSKRAADLRARASQNCANRARSLALSGGGAARALATCGRPAALVGVGSCPLKAYCASGTAVSRGARACFGVRAACSKRAADLRACASQNCANRAHALSLSLGMLRRTGACAPLPAALRWLTSALANPMRPSPKSEASLARPRPMPSAVSRVSVGLQLSQGPRKRF